MRGRKIGSGAIPLEDVLLMVEMNKKGCSKYKIAKELGHSTNTVYRYLNKFGMI